MYLATVLHTAQLTLQKRNVITSKMFAPGFMYVIYEYVSIPTLYLFTARTLKAELLPYMIFVVLAVDGGN